jgi:arylsulfatase A-like enzyme
MPKRVFLLSIDDLRWDALSCEEDTRYLDRYGLAGMRSTPALDALAARGARFTQAIATASYTPASHASMLSGCYPPAHGVRAFLRNRLPAGVPLLAEQLQAYGFHTVSAIDFGPMFTLLGLDRGFEARFAADDQALFAHLAERRDEALFCFVHFVDVHPPVGESFCPPWEGYNDDFYDGLERIAGELGVPFEPLERGTEAGRRRAVELSGRVRMAAEDRRIADAVEFPRYLAGVSKFDGGRLRAFLDRLADLGLDDGALVVATSDHGQGPMPGWTMGDPRVPLKFDHGETVREEAIRVPLVMAGPGVPPGTVVEGQVSLVDLAPTLLDWAAVDVPEEMQGRSLLDMTGEGSTAYAEVWFHDRSELSRYLKRSLAAGDLAGEGYETFLSQRAVRTPRFKYSRRGAALSPDEWAAPEPEFIRACFHKLLGRVVGPGAAHELERELRGGALTRERLAEELARRAGHREALYDLAADPQEEVNLLALAASLRTLDREHEAPAVAAELAAEMDRIESATAHAAPVAAAAPAGDADLEQVEARLRDLGYIE